MQLRRHHATLHARLQLAGQALLVPAASASAPPTLLLLLLLLLLQASAICSLVLL